jgi:hypothetical protein
VLSRSIVSIRNMGIIRLLIAIIVLAIYLPVADAPYFADDYEYVFIGRQVDSVYLLTHTSPMNFIGFRPLQAVFLYGVQSAFGLETWPVRVMHIAMHMATVLLVLHIAKNLGFTLLQSAIAAIYIAVSQIGTHPIVNNDTLSQLGGTFFTLLSGWYTYTAVFRDGSPSASTNTRRMTFAVISCALALLMKETSVAAPLLVGSILVYREYAFRDRLYAGAKRVLLLILPFLVVTVTYLVARTAAGALQPELGSGYQNLQLGLNNLSNFAQLLLATIVPVSTVSVYFARFDGNILSLLFFGVLSLGVMVAVIYGLIHEPRRRLLWALAVSLVISTVPAVGMHRVSELYAYNVLPYMSIIVGVGLGRFILSQGRRLFQVTAVSATIAIILANVEIAVNKGAQIQANGHRAKSQLTQLRSTIKSLPYHAKLVLVGDKPDIRSYSIFVQPDLPHTFLLAMIAQGIEKRSDVYVNVMTTDEARWDTCTTVLTLAPDGVWQQTQSVLTRMSECTDAQPASMD